MTRGNWQKRVETAEARRRDAKHKKKQSEDKKVYKSWVHELFRRLDQDDSLWLRRRPQHQATVHIWTDAMPSSGPPLLDLLEQHSTNASMSSSPMHNKRRPRSASVESEGSAGGGYLRGNAGKAGKKKVHPRSKETQQAAEVSTEDATSGVPLLLCQRHFLYGKCPTAKKGGNSSCCKYVHYTSKQYPTLGSVLQQPPKQQPQSGAAVLKAVDTALSSSGMSASPDSVEAGSMDMLYYTSLDVQRGEDDDEAEKGLTSITEQLLSHLGQSQSPLVAVVYIVIDHHLVFDRNQGGVQGTALDALVHAIQRPRQSSVGSEHDVDADDLAKRLPAAVLELILTFLPDAAVASCSQVCRAWNCEIGQHSPNLWLALLQRHDWQRPQNVVTHLDTQTPTSPDSNHSNPQWLFQNHYVAVRDVQALASAVPVILSLGRQSSSVPEEKEVTFQTFGSRKHAPQESDTCVALEEWSTNHVLAGYAHECTLRLFQAVAFKGSEKRCKELVCMSIDPYKSTKKRTCTLDAVGLDENTIGCLCHVASTHLQQDVSAFVLVILSRDDFLLGENSAVAAKGGGGPSSAVDCEAESLQVIDVGEAVLNYILSSDVVDHRLLPLFDYLTDSGGEVGDISTLVSRQSIAACGYGRFMVEVSISIPTPDTQSEDDDGNENRESTILLDRKLVLFSANTESIVWMGDSYPSPGLPPAAAVPAVVTSLRQFYVEGGSRMGCTIAAGSILTPFLITCDIDPSGVVFAPRLVDQSDAVRGSLLSQPGTASYPSRCLIVSSSHIIVKDTVYRANEEGEHRDVKSSLIFFPRVENNRENESTTSTVFHLSGNVRIHDMVCLRDEYVLAICSEFEAVDATPAQNGEEEEDGVAADLDGQWFAPANNANHDAPATTPIRREFHVMVVVHIPRPGSEAEEIGRIRMSTAGISYHDLGPRFMRSSGGTVSLALGGFGLAMTGHDIRGLKEQSVFHVWDDTGSKSQKKKRPAKTKKGSKKDGFARGMSLRG